MGTRNLTMVINQEGETKIAQYGQWDGYPSVQGIDALEFLSIPENIEKLKNNFKKVRFLDDEGKDKEFIEEYIKNVGQWSNEPDNRTPEQIKWFSSYMSRDLGAEILYNVANSKDEEILLRDQSEFGKDTVFCEWVYVVNFNTNKFIVLNDLVSEPIKEFDLSNLPTEEEFLKSFKGEE